MPGQIAPAAYAMPDNQELQVADKRIQAFQNSLQSVNPITSDAKTGYFPGINPGCRD
jgi:hypothetical protein